MVELVETPATAPVISTVSITGKLNHRIGARLPQTCWGRRALFCLKRQGLVDPGVQLPQFPTARRHLDDATPHHRRVKRLGELRRRPRQRVPPTVSGGQRTQVGGVRRAKEAFDGGRIVGCLAKGPVLQDVEDAAAAVVEDDDLQAGNLFASTQEERAGVVRTSVWSQP